MSQVFAAIDLGDRSLGVKVFRDEVTTEIAQIMPIGSLIVVEDGAPETRERIKCEVRLDVASSPISGWVAKASLGPPLKPEQIGALLNPFRIDLFIVECASQEVASSTGSVQAPTFAASADYLIALALILSGLSAATASLVTGDRVGPFQFSAADWDEVVAANPQSTFQIFDRFLPLMQIRGATYYATKHFADCKALAEASGATDPAQPFIPSFLNLFHSWLLGPKAAFEIMQLHDGMNANQPLKAALAALVPDLDGRLERSKSVAMVDATTSVDAYMEATSQKLNAALVDAFDLLRKHAADFVAGPVSTNAPWLDVAEAEQAAWNMQDEATPFGKARIIGYFNEIGIPSDGTLAWCGAFVANCLLDWGAATVASSLVNGPARAANWKGWGNRALRVGDPNLPPGAVVVMTPSPGTNTSGHVTFLKSVLPGGLKIECVGGNQSNTCRAETYSISRIAAVRWLDIAAPGAATAPTTLVADATMIVAQTLFGEARGEPTRECREAVANVIMNRVASQKSFYGLTPAEVCQKKWQFSCWNDTQPNPNLAAMTNPAQQKTAVFAECLAIAAQALVGGLPDVTGGATHYHATSIAKPDWALKPGVIVTLTLFGHIFYRNVD